MPEGIELELNASFEVTSRENIKRLEAHFLPTTPENLSLIDGSKYYLTLQRGKNVGTLGYDPKSKRWYDPIDNSVMPHVTHFAPGYVLKDLS